MTVLIDRDYIKRFQAVADRNHEKFLKLRDELNDLAKTRTLTATEQMLRDEVETAINPTEEDLAY